MSDAPKHFSIEDLTKSLEELPVWGKTLVAGGLILACYLPYSWYRGNARDTPITKNYQKDVVYVYQFPRTSKIPSISSACLKLETWLRMAEVQYENVPIGITTRGLDGALPFVEINGKEYSHSSTAIKAVQSELKKGGLDDHLSDEQKSVGHAFERMAQLSLSTSHLIFRAENADKVIGLIPSQHFGFFAPLANIFVQKAYLGRCASILSSSTIGRFSREERIEFGTADLRALSKYLGAKHYFTGFKPTSVDATLFAVLAQLVYAPYDNIHTQLLQGECNNLQQFVERMKGRYWPDWTEATTSHTSDSNWKRKPATSPVPRSEQRKKSNS